MLTESDHVGSAIFVNRRAIEVSFFSPLPCFTVSFFRILFTIMDFVDTKESSEQTVTESSSTQELNELDQMDNLKISDTATEEPLGQSGLESSVQYDPSKIMAGSTFPRASRTSVRRDQKPPSHTFSPCDTSSFLLRVGPNYAKTGAKAPAGPSLYEVAGME